MINLNLRPFSLGRRRSPPGALQRAGAVSFARALWPAFFAAFALAAFFSGIAAASLYALGAASPSLLSSAPPPDPGRVSWARAADAPLLTSSGLAAAAAFVVWAVAFAFGDRSRSDAVVQATALGVLAGVVLAALSF